MVNIIQKISGKDLATLAVITAVDIDTTMSNLNEASLLTYLKVGLNIVYHSNVLDSWIIGLAYGDATIAQIANALTVAVTNPENSQDFRANQIEERFIIDWDFVPVNEVVDQTITYNWVPRLPKGGIPANKGDGYKLFAFNPSDVRGLADGPILRTLTKWIFVWMGRS